MLEDLLSQLDYSIGEGRPLGDKYTLGRLREIRESFIYSICEVLRTTLHSSSEVLNAFLKQVEEDDTIISLNYELVIDSALNTHLERALDYGVPVRHRDDGQTSVISTTPDQAQQPPIRLYKLHGSLNWLYCPFCQELQLTPGDHAVHYLFEQQASDQPVRCEQCHTPYEPLIITPTMAKTYANLLLNEIWRLAEDRLMRADRIVFPDTQCPIRMCIYAACSNGRCTLM